MESSWPQTRLWYWLTHWEPSPISQPFLTGDPHICCGAGSQFTLVSASDLSHWIIFWAYINLFFKKLAIYVAAFFSNQTPCSQELEGDSAGSTVLTCMQVTQIWSPTLYRIQALPRVIPKCRDKTKPWILLAVAPKNRKKEKEKKILDLKPIRRLALQVHVLSWICVLFAGLWCFFPSHVS